MFFNLKWQVFWLTPIGGGLPVPVIGTGTVAVVAANMKGLQLRVQLRTSCLWADRAPDSLNTISIVKIN